MPQNFIPADRDQAMLLPLDMREWLPEDHLSLFLIETVEALDLEALYAGYRADGHGRAAYDPAMMTTLILYGYCVSLTSARAIERACLTDVAFRVISANRQPDHATIARFQSRHQERLAALFGQVLELCAQAGLTGGEAIAVDSTKLSASASGAASRSYEQIAREIAEQAVAENEAEDELYGERRGDEVLPEIKTAAERRAWIREKLGQIEREREQEAVPRDRSARLAECKERLEARHEAEQTAQRAYEQTRERRRAAGRKPIGRPPSQEPRPELAGRQINTTDPDSVTVRHPRGFKQGYSAHAACSEGQVIVACELIAQSSDGGRLEPMVTAAHENLAAAGETVPARVLADAGYWQQAQIARLEANGFEVLVPPDRHGRSVNAKSPLGRRQRERLREPEAAGRYRARQVMIEPIFGQTKSNRGFERLSRRGIVAARSEWSLICLTHNLLKLFRARSGPSFA